MKRNILTILALLISQLLFSQTKPVKYNDADPFCQMINTIYSLEAVSFNSQVNIKNLFEIDTITSFAKVTVKKDGTNISYLRIIPETGDKELLYCHDSAWETDHNDHVMQCIGTNTDALAHNSMAKFFSFTLYNTDTMISQVEPFWKTIGRDNTITRVSLDITNYSKELSDVKAEFTIGNSDFLPYRTLQESVYLKMDKLYQEQIFSAYSFPDPEQVWVPEYFFIYEKDFSILQKRDSLTIVVEEKAEEDIFLTDIELYDLSGHTFTLPANGLIFLDLWYVGCSACMKSAPVIDKLYLAYMDKIHFYSLNEIDRDTAKIERFKEKMEISFPVLLGGKQKLAIKLTGSNAYPLFILIDARTRKVLWKLTGYTENLEELIVKAIDLND